MAINILTANTFRGAFSGIAKIIKCNNSDKLKDKHIIIAPDRFTLTLEKLILEELGLSCAVNIEVVSFSRLAVKILKDDVKKFLSPQGAIMLMQKAAMNLNDNFKLYSACANKDGFAKQVFAVVSEIRNSNITSDELKNTVKNLKGKTKSKIEDLAKIYEEYLSLLNENYVDTTSRLNALSKIIPESSYLATANVYVTDFYSFNAVEMKLIELLAENSLNFTIALLNKNKGRNIRIYPTDTYNKVLNVLNNSGNKIEMIFCEESLKEPFSAIEENLFGYSDKKVQSSDRVHINYGGDAYEEVLFIANKINEGLLGGGRFKDNAIVCSDIKKYQSILQEVFQRMDIPYFIDKKFPLKNVTQIKFILDGLECVNNNLERTFLLKFAKSYHFKDENVCDFEDYIYKYNINYSMFKKPFNIGDEEEIKKAEKTRSALMEKLHPILSSAQITFTEFYKEIKEFIKINDLESEENLLSDIQKSEGYLNNSNATKRGLEKFYEIAEEQNRIFGALSDTPKNHLKILKCAVETTELSFIPLLLDSVFIGDPNESRYTGIKNLFVLGAIDGEFPKLINDDGILTLKEIGDLKLQGINVEPDFKALNRESKFNILQLLIKPTDNLFITYSLTDKSGEKNFPSPIIKELENILSIKSQPCSRQFYALNEENRIRNFANKVWNKKNGRLMLAEHTGDMKESYENEEQVYYDALKDLLNFSELKENSFNEYINNRFSEKAKYSSTELETYFSCPYKHFLRYNLKLKPKEEFGLKALDKGSLIHAVLELFFKETKGKILTKQECDFLARSVISKIISKNKYKYVFEQLKGLEKIITKECVNICSELYINSLSSEFKIYDLEKKFDIDLDGISVNGKIDRIDLYNNNVIVIDYKTSSSVKSSLKDVYFGNKIQLYIYLNALGKYNAVGAFYLPVSDKYVKEEMKDERFRFKGQIINDVDIIKKLDIKLNGENLKSCIFPVSLSATDDGLTVKKADGVLGKEEMADVIDYVKRLAIKATSEISKGYIAKKPCSSSEAESGDTSCTYCEFKQLCRGEKLFRVQRGTKSAKDFKEAENVER